MTKDRLVQILLAVVLMISGWQMAQIYSIAIKLGKMETEIRYIHDDVNTLKVHFQGKQSKRR